MRYIQKKWLSLLIGLLLISFAHVALAKSETYDSPVGYWWQISDKTGKTHSIMQVWQEGNQLKGKVVKAYPDPGKQLQVYCYKCPGQFKNKLIVGLPIIWGLTYNSTTDRWDGGNILDPDSGDIYKVSMTLANKGTQLVVRGYVGVSLFGRSQTWIRIPTNQVAHALKSNTPGI